MLRMKKRVIEKIRWSMYVFVLIFAPPFMPYPHLALAVISAMALVIKYKKNFEKIAVLCGVNRWVFGMLLLFLYVCTVPLTISFFLQDIVDVSHYRSLFNRFAVLVITLAPCTTLLVCKLWEKKDNYQFFVEILVWAGMLEGFCSIGAFLSPQIKNVFIALMKKFTGDGLYSNTWYITVRSYGFAGTLVDLFGAGTAIISGICFFYGVTEKRRYVVYSVITIIPAFLNARTGVVLYALAVIVVVLFLIWKARIKKIVRVTASVIFLFLVAQLGTVIVSTQKYTATWIKSGIEALKTLVTEGFSGAQDETVISSWLRQERELPDVFRCVIGTGHSVYQAAGYKHSDIGYINDIWFCGIIGCVFLYGTVVYMAWKIYKNTDILTFKIAALYIPIVLFVFNFKACLLGYSPGAAAMYLCLFVMTYYIRRKNCAEI